MLSKLFEIGVVLFLLLIGLLWALLEVGDTWACYKPDLLLLAIFFILTAMPKRLNIFSAWCVGLLADVLYGVVLGDYALQFAFVALVVHVLYRPISGYSVIQQGLVLLLLQTVIVALHMALFAMVYKQLNHCGFYAILPTAIAWPLFHLLINSIYKPTPSR